MEYAKEESCCKKPPTPTHPETHSAHPNLDERLLFRYTIKKRRRSILMGIVAMIGLIFGPFVSLLFAAWFYVRWQNEEDEELALHNKKICFRALIAAAILLVVFGILKLIFPVA